MSEVLEIPTGGGRPPVVPRAGDDVFVRRINHAARQDMFCIPRPIMHRLGLRRGDSVVVWQEGETICIRSVKLDRIFEQGVKK